MVAPARPFIQAIILKDPLALWDLNLVQEVESAVDRNPGLANEINFLRGGILKIEVNLLRLWVEHISDFLAVDFKGWDLDP